MLKYLLNICRASQCEGIAMIFAAIIAITPGAWSHGEDKPGPNGGFIKMPGAFHTEIILEGKNALKVYLLDMEWKNPSITNSSVEIIAVSKSKNKKNEIKATCSTKDTYYLCQFSKEMDLTKRGSLTIKAKREGAIGNSVNYDLPLQLPLPAKNDGHEGHH